MYTKKEYDYYSALLHESGITDEGQIKTVLDFVYRLAVEAANEYIDHLNKSKDGTETSI